jgi:hypothetical protein
MRPQPAYVTGPMASYNQVRKAKEAAAREANRQLAMQVMWWSIGIGMLVTFAPLFFGLG